MKKKLLSLALALVMCLSLLPGNAQAAAARKEALINLSQLTKEDQITYGVYRENPVFWHVLDPRYAFDGGTSGLFLLSKNVLGDEEGDQFHETDLNNTNWAESTARQWCLTFAGSALNPAEARALLTVPKTEGQVQLYGIAWDSNTVEDPVFFLSAQELADYVVADRVDSILRAGLPGGMKSEIWWLRSTTRSSGPHAGIVPAVGDTGSSAFLLAFHYPRPALNLNPENIVMLHPAGAEIISQQTSGVLPEVQDTGTKEWKMTVLDPERSGFRAYGTGKEGFRFRNAKNGPGECISALVADDAKETVLKYGVVVDQTNTNWIDGFTGIYDLGNMTGKSLYVCNEKINGANLSNLGSRLFRIPLESDMAPSLRPTVMAGTTGLSGGRIWEACQGFTYTLPTDYVYFGIDGQEPILWRVLDGE